MEDEEWARAAERSRLRRQEKSVERRRGRQRFAALGAGAALAFLVGAALGAGGGDDGSGGEAGGGEAEAPKLAELPGGGRTIFPDRRVVAFYGTDNTAALGTLGAGTPAQAARRLVRQSRAWRTRRKKVLPAFELIATVAANSPGDDGLYRNQRPLAAARRFLEAVRKVGGILIIDVQPGQADFLPEVRRFEPLLREPDVSLALDPEWKMDPGEVPGQVIGSTDAATVNGVSRYLSQIVRRGRLPQKLLVVHQFTEDMVEDRRALRRFPGVALTINVDGFGGREIKRQKYDQLVPRRRGIFPGFKLFYTEDVNMFGARDVLRFKPVPLLINYQ